MNGGRFIFADGGSFTGGWEEGKAHGHGICTGPQNKGEYSGAWHYGFETSGVYTWPSGNTFEGQWENGRRHGLGVETKGRWVYRGEWTQGYKGKYGVIQSLASGARYEGTWCSGLQDGYGQEIYADGGIYHGQWVGGMRHGYGIRNSVPYGMASIVRPALRTSLTSLRSEHENGSVTISENFGQRGGFVLDVSDTETSDAENWSSSIGRSGSLKRTFIDGLRLKRKKKRDRSADSSVTSQSDSGVSSTRGRSRLPKQDSLKSTESGESSVPSTTVYDSDTNYLHDEEAAHDVTEVYIGEWSKDKRTGYGISQRSDGLCYVGEWQSNKRHGYGVLTHPDGHKDEGKWKHNMLVASGKKKLFMGSKKISERVDRAVQCANQATNLARQKADLAISRAAYAKEKAEQADVACSHAREDAAHASLRAKELTSKFPSKGEEDSSIRYDRKKSFFGRTLGGLDRFDRKSHMRGTIIKQKEQSLHDSYQDKPNSNWQRHNGSATHIEKHLPDTYTIQSSSSQHSPSLDRRRDDHVTMMPNGYHHSHREPSHFDDHYSSYSSHDAHSDQASDYHYKSYGDNRSVELTPDSGVSTMSETERFKSSNEFRRNPIRRQLTRQSGLDDHRLNHLDLQSTFDAKEFFYEEDSPTLTPPPEKENTKQKKKIKAKSKSFDLHLLNEIPPGHYRSFQGKFPSTCGIKYIPKEPSLEEEEPTDPELDPEAALAVHTTKKWSASGPMVVLVLVLNVGFTVLFSQLFQLDEVTNWLKWSQ
ncbi:junctophilin-2-like [Antedon mediterranea]|uniref:junctophilin-2-like n=1 Tax=Antedon mediterranea TaxID=105859 RepID=UPI003AF77D86